ncbi:MAG TPA: hypothetical protein VGK99_17550 [Acidobacteriota bacterium]|jgi:hypothetical protein
MKKLIKRVAAQSNAKLKRLGERLGINLTLPITGVLLINSYGSFRGERGATSL